MHVLSFINISSQHYLTGSQYASGQNWLMEPIWLALLRSEKGRAELEKSFVGEIEEC